MVEPLQSRFECEDLIDGGKVAVVQPDVRRVRGPTGVQMADERDLTIE